MSVKRFEDLIARQKASALFDELLAQANEVANVVAGLRAAVDRGAATAGS